jgi:Protein of unknown function (DUF998)
VANVETAAGVVCLAATAVGVGAIVVLHLLPTGLSPMRNAVSQYGITRYRLGYRIQTISLGVAGAAAAVGIAEAAPGRGRLVLVLLGVFAVARLAISWFPMDAPGSEPTSDGRAHGLLAIATFLAIIVAAARLPQLVHTIGGWHGVATASVVIAWAMVASMVAMIASRRTAGSGSGYFGMAERVLYVAIVVWLIAVGIALV